MSTGVETVTITGLDYRYKVVYGPVTLENVVGMAYGVHEDILAGKRGLIVNQCVASNEICWWNVEDL